MGIGVGDVIYLKSGGPAMTVTTLLPNGDVSVHWMNGAALSAGTFPAAAVSAEFTKPIIEKTERDVKDRIDPAPADTKPA